MEFNLPTIISLVTLITVGYNVFLGVRKPNEDQNLAIALLREQLKNGDDQIKMYADNTAGLVKAYQNDLHSVQGRTGDLERAVRELTTAVSVLHNTVELKLKDK